MNKTGLMLLLVFIAALAGAYSVYKPFLLSMTVAVLLSMATFNLTQRLDALIRSPKATASLTTLLMVMLLFAPIVYLATVGVNYLSHLDIAGIKQTVSNFRELIERVPALKTLSQSYMSDEQIASYIKASTSYITAFGSSGIGFIKNMLFVVLFYFFVNYYGNRFFDTILALLPVSSDRGERMLKEVSATMEIVFYSIIVTAIFEGFLFGIAMSYFGFNGLFWGVVYGFASLIPIVGGFIVWAPVALYIWTKGDAQTALIIASYSVIVISIVADTFIKPMIIEVIKRDFLRSPLKISSILIFFSILAGMSTYGFWGMVLGPAVTSFLIAITKVYLDYNEGEYR